MAANRSRTLAIAAGLVVLAALVGAGGYWFQNTRSSTQGDAVQTAPVTRSDVNSTLRVTGFVAFGRKENVLTVPNAAIRSRDGIRMVAKIVDGSPRLVRVETGLADDERTEIVSGLSEGDRIVVSETELMDQAAQEITALLLSRHGISDPEEADFRVLNQQDLLETVGQVTGIMTLLLGGIASVSLLVGGIGIMNIMLVSVTERTREIGLRKAVGARRRDILKQFLIESVMISLTGGLIGVLLGIGGSKAMSALSGFVTLVSAGSVLLAFFFAAFVGVFFGIFPAMRAARLNPIDALRYE